MHTCIYIYICDQIYEHNHESTYDKTDDASVITCMIKIVITYVIPCMTKYIIQIMKFLMRSMIRQTC